MHTVRLAASAAALLVTLTACVPGPAAKWTTLKEPAWGFAVDFPGPPKVVDNPPSAADNNVHSLLAQIKRDDVQLGVSVFDAAHSDKSPDQLLSGMAQAMGKDAKLTQTYVAVGKVVGRDMQIESPGQPIVRMRVFVADHKLYEVIGASVRGPTDPTLVRFLDSFRLPGE